MAYNFIIMILKIALVLLFIRLCCKLRKVDFNNVFDTLIVSLPAALLGGRIYYILINIDKYNMNIINMLNVNKGGFSKTGILIGAFSGACIYIIYKKYSFLDVMDVIAPGLIFGDMIFKFSSLGYNVDILMLIILMFITKMSQKRGSVVISYLVLIFVVNII